MKPACLQPQVQQTSQAVLRAGYTPIFCFYLFSLGFVCCLHLLFICFNTGFLFSSICVLSVFVLFDMSFVSTLVLFDLSFVSTLVLFAQFHLLWPEIFVIQNKTD